MITRLIQISIVAKIASVYQSPSTGINADAKQVALTDAQVTLLQSLGNADTVELDPLGSVPATYTTETQTIDGVSTEVQVPATFRAAYNITLTSTTGNTQLSSESLSDTMCDDVIALWDNLVAAN